MLCTYSLMAMCLLRSRDMTHLFKIPSKSFSGFYTPLLHYLHHHSQLSVLSNKPIRLCQTQRNPLTLSQIQQITGQPLHYQRLSLMLNLSCSQISSRQRICPRDLRFPNQIAHFIGTGVVNPLNRNFPTSTLILSPLLPLILAVLKKAKLGHHFPNNPPTPLVPLRLRLSNPHALEENKT